MIKDNQEKGVPQTLKAQAFPKSVNILLYYLASR